MAAKQDWRIRLTDSLLILKEFLVSSKTLYTTFIWLMNEIIRNWCMNDWYKYLQLNLRKFTQGSLVQTILGIQSTYMYWKYMPGHNMGLEFARLFTGSSL